MNDKVYVKAFDPFGGQSDTNGNDENFWPIPQLETSFKAPDIWHHSSAASAKLNIGQLFIAAVESIKEDKIQ